MMNIVRTHYFSVAPIAYDRQSKFRQIKSRQTQRGTAAVEFAMLLVPMLLLAFGVIEYGRAVYHYNTLVKSVRSAVRLMSVYSPDSPDYSTHMAEARCLAVYGNANCTGPTLVPSLSTSQVKICDRKSWSDCSGSSQASYRNVTTGSGTINLVAIRVSGYSFPFIGLPLVTTSPTKTFGTIESVMRQAV